jgi:hypothetical protein
MASQRRMSRLRSRGAAVAYPDLWLNRLSFGV